MNIGNIAYHQSRLLRMSFKRVLRSSARTPSDPSSKDLAKADDVQTEAKTRQKATKSTITDTEGRTSSTENDSPSTPRAKRIKTGENPQIPNALSHVSSHGTLEPSVTPKSIDTEKLFPNRPAEPHGTNATLKTPGGSRLVPHSKEVVDSSPIKSGSSKPTTTTQHLLEQACAHLVSVDARMKPLIERHHCRVFSPEGLAEELDPFESLCSSIISQQVSGAAAKSIKNKFIGLFHNTPDKSPEVPAVFPTPTQVFDCQIPFLRTAGLSERKAEYIKGLAEKFHCGDLSAKMLLKASDEEVLAKLVSVFTSAFNLPTLWRGRSFIVNFFFFMSKEYPCIFKSKGSEIDLGYIQVAVRGLGRWSVEMFACFALKRMDVLSTGDLGVQYVFVDIAVLWLILCRRGMAAFIGKDVKKLKAKGGKWKYLSVWGIHDRCIVDTNTLQEKEMLDISAPFSPYRSVFMWYMVCGHGSFSYTSYFEADDHPTLPIKLRHSCSVN